MRRARWIVLFLAPVIQLSAADNQLVTLKGKLVDELGHPIVQAEVVVVPKAVGKPKSEVRLASSATGQFSTRLTAGVYDVFISDDCLAPVAREVVLKSSQLGTLTITMHHSALVICDTIGAGEPPPPFVPSGFPDHIQPK